VVAWKFFKIDYSTFRQGGTNARKRWWQSRHRNTPMQKARKTFRHIPTLREARTLLHVHRGHDRVLDTIAKYPVPFLSYLTTFPFPEPSEQRRVR
jgi:hypothetical protein